MIFLLSLVVFASASNSELFFPKHFDDPNSWGCVKIQLLVDEPEKAILTYKGSDNDQGKETKPKKITLDDITVHKVELYCEDFVKATVTFGAGAERIPIKVFSHSTSLPAKLGKAMSSSRYSCKCVTCSGDGVSDGRKCSICEGTGYDLRSLYYNAKWTTTIEDDFSRDSPLSARESALPKAPLQDDTKDDFPADELKPPTSLDSDAIQATDVMPTESDSRLSRHGEAASRKELKLLEAKCNGFTIPPPIQVSDF